MNEAENNYLNPSYYQTPQGYQAIDIIQAFCLDFCAGNAVKYILRAGKKGEKKDEIMDMEKAIWYLERKIKELKGE